MSTVSTTAGSNSGADAGVDATTDDLPNVASDTPAEPATDGALVAVSPPGTLMEVGKVAGTADSTPLKYHVALLSAPTSSSTTSSSSPATCPVSGRSSPLAWSPRSAPATRARGSVRRLPDRRRRAARPCPGGRRGDHDPRRPELYVPPRPAGGPPGVRRGARPGAVLRPDGRQVPVGLGRDGEPIFLNLEFLDGTRGAHCRSAASWRRHEDQLRAVPAALAVHLRRARRRP